ncbi:MAG: rhamnogalacturonan lyase [Bacteroidaceae bacterium]|nr:rhamnogalacturonan lyase [Bacteroidaceae bacterium]
MRTAFALLFFGLASFLQAQPPLSPSSERLGRGLVVKPGISGGEFVSWRFLATDDLRRTTFDILRDGEVIKADMSKETSFRDARGKYTSQYQIITKVDGVAVDTTAAVTPWRDAFYRLHLDRPADGSDYTYSPGDCSVGDVDGDGEYEIFVKWDPSNQKDNSQEGKTGNVYLDCYKVDWTQGGQGCTPQRLWRIDLGVNIRAGAHYTQYMVYDFDGDGRAEMMCKTAPGSLDGQGAYVSEAATLAKIKTVNNSRDWRNGNGRIDGGYEFLTVFEGLTGKAIHTVFYKPNRNATTVGSDAAGTFNWDDRSGRTDKAGYGNRGERYLACVAHLDGMDKPACGVFSRGYYTYAYVWAVGFDGEQLTDKWYHASDTRTNYKLTDSKGATRTYSGAAATSGGGSRTLYGNGNHNLSVGDVDGDGCDEIVWGSSALDHDGKLLYATGLGHGDAIHLADHDPTNPGLEVFQIHEASPYGWDLHDAATGKILYSATGGKDNGRGIAAQLSPDHRCSFFCSSNDGQLRSATTGNVVSSGGTSMNFRIFWDGDLQEELFDGGQITKWNSSGVSRLYVQGKNPYDYENSSTINGTKSTPCLQADLFGDWREEVVLMNSSDRATLNIFTTNETTTYRVPTLMHDHVYRMGVCWQNTAYNQPPHLGYFLPDSYRPSVELADTAQAQQTVVLGDSIAPVLLYYNMGTAVLDSTTTPSAKQKGMADGFELERSSLLKTLTLTGAPTEVGDYVFLFRISGNKMHPDKVYCPVVVHVVSSTGVGAPSAAVAPSDSFVDISGRPLKGQPLRRGVYINNGHKIAIK